MLFSSLYLSKLPSQFLFYKNCIWMHWKVYPFNKELRHSPVLQRLLNALSSRESVRRYFDLWCIYSPFCKRCVTITTVLKRKTIVFFIIFLMCICVSCEWEFAMVGRADFSDRYLHEMLATYNAQLESEKKADNRDDDEFSFFGVGREDIEEMIANFGGCIVDGRAKFVVEVSGISIKKIYLPSGSELYGKLDCKNSFSKKVFVLAENMKNDFQGLEINFSDDFKVCELRYTYLSDMVLFDSKNSNDKFSISDFREASNSKDTCMKLSDGKIKVEFLKTVPDSEMYIILEKLR